MRRFAACACILALVSAAPAAADAVWPDVIAAAQREGRVTLYSASVGTVDYVKVARSFEAKYGIGVDILEARASEIRERNRAERTAGRPIADVMWNGRNATLLEQSDDMLQSLGPLPRLSALLPQFASDGVSVPVALTTYGILINTALVSPDAAPRSWRDLLDARWRGKILADDMRALGGGSVFFTVTYDRFGADFHRALAQQQLQFSRALPENQRRIARGEFPLYIPLVLSDALRLKGLPVRAIVPEEGAPYVAFHVSILKRAPHANAARLLVNHFLEADAHTVFVASGRATSFAGDDREFPADVRAVAEAKLMGTTEPTRQEKMLQLATEIYKAP
jgi:iron(III) transport system substrate-binding protein